MTQEVLKLALEALEEWRFGGDPRAADKYITAIKEALAQPTSSDYALGYSIGFGEGHSAGKALREHAMREVQRLGQEIEQEPVGYWKEHAQGLQRDYDSLLADFQAQSGQKLIGTVGELFDDKVIAHRKLDRDLLVYIKENT